MRERVFVLVFGGIAGLVGCSQGQLLTVLDLFAENAACMIANQDLAMDQAIRKCGVRAENIERVMKLVAESRKAGEAKAVAARAEQAERDQKAGVCKVP